MGVLYDYFRAPGPAEVRAHMDAHEASSPVPEVYEGVGLKMIDPAVCLAQLIGFVTGGPGGSGELLVWPAGTEADGDYPGPWVTVLGDEARDVLAGIPAERVPELAGRWSGIEEFGGFLDADFLGEVITDLAGLAARARERHESIYCWICL
ncbi:hypothetical protein ACTOB_002981 [Actinoplanes oblitus]|uniref:DUF1877 domain-containing protein n=1 Tax=Actinoplanes oblitus TaxID=3040509 RepID=A0ABY8WQR8_9ACTN|nr:hypothetical protein [Actinoplanes oblitus]WIM99331.1 hypothetical protein ACTOB_002981 [Actinoplanes oblitus]